MLIIAASFWNNSLAENKSRAESHEMRMLMLSSVPSQYHVGQKAMARETMKKAYDLTPDGYSAIS